MNRRLGGDTSLNATLRADGDGDGEWQDWLVDGSDSQEEVLVQNEEVATAQQLPEGSADQS